MSLEKEDPVVEKIIREEREFRKKLLQSAEQTIGEFRNKGKGGNNAD